MMFDVVVSTVTLAFAQAALAQVSTLGDTSAAQTNAPALIVVAQAAEAPPAADTVETATAPAPGDAAATEDDFTPVFADKSDEQVADEVVAYLESLTTLEGDFIQTAPSGAVATGQIYLRRPGQARFDYDDPSPLTIVATQGQVYVQDDALDQTDSYPLKKTPLKFLLSKKIDLSDAQLTGVDRWDDAVAVTFASTDSETEGELTLVLRAPDLAIDQWAIRDSQNGVTVVQLQNLKSDIRLDNRLFRVPEAGGAFINN